MLGFQQMYISDLTALILRKSVWDRNSQSFILVWQRSMLCKGPFKLPTSESPLTFVYWHARAVLLRCLAGPQEVFSLTVAAGWTPGRRMTVCSYSRLRPLPSPLSFPLPSHTRPYPPFFFRFSLQALSCPFTSVLISQPFPPATKSQTLPADDRNK